MKIIYYYSLVSMCLFGSMAMAQNVVVNDISITGNKQSRTSVILRELTFVKGDTLSLEKLQAVMETSRNNLFNTSLFNYVYVTADTPTNNAAVNICITVEERWYIWPVIDLVFEDRNISTWIRNPDWSRFSFGAGINIQNMRGLNEKLHVTARIGYQRGLSLSYSDISLDRAKRHLFGFSTAYNIVHNAAYATKDNQPDYITAYGSPLRERYVAGINYLYRPAINERHTINASLEYTNINDTLLALNPDYWGGNKSHRSSINITYAYANDHRDVYFYPLKGTFLKISATTDVALDGSLVAGSLYPELSFYQPLAARWFYAGSFNGKITAVNTHAHVANKALGYGSNYLRGYEDYVVDGQYFALSKNTLRFLLMPTKIVELKWLSSLPKFNKIHFTIYANVFADFGYAYNPHKNQALQNTFENAFLYSGGAGIDLVTYYDIVLRVDYSVNKKRESGFYITLITPFF